MATNHRKILVEIVKDFDGRYYANMTINGELVRDLPEYVDYNTLRNCIKEHYHFELIRAKELIFEKIGRKQYAYMNNYIEGDCRQKPPEAMNETPNIEESTLFISDGKCPRCGGRLHEETDHKSNADWQFCSRCGFSLITTLSLEGNITTASDRSGGHGIMFIAFGERIGEIHSLDEGLSKEQALALFEEALKKEYEQTVSVEDSYLTYWDKETDQLICLKGKMPPSFDEDAARYETETGTADEFMSKKPEKYVVLTASNVDELIQTSPAYATIEEARKKLSEIYEQQKKSCKKDGNLDSCNKKDDYYGISCSNNDRYYGNIQPLEIA